LVDLSRSQQLCGGPNNRSKQLGELRSPGFALAEKLVFFASNLQTQRLWVRLPDLAAEFPFLAILLFG
jgi:hypothetical protein